MEKLYFTKEHEWVRAQGNSAYVGITDYAQKALGEIVFIDMPSLGAELTAGQTLGAVESVKSVADIYSPVGGTVEEINKALDDDPGAVNRQPYESWIARLRLSAPAEVEGLMDSDAYADFCEKEPA